MIKLFRTTQSKFNNLKQLVITGFAGRSTVTAEEYSPHGIDSRPPKDTTVLYTTTQRDGDEAIIGCLNKDRLAEIGETRLFCVDSSGAFKYNVWLRSDGVLLIGDSKAPAEYVKNLTRFQELETGFNQFKTDFNTFIQLYNAHTHLTTTPGNPTSIPPVLGVQTSATIVDAKIDNIKVI